MLNLTKALQLAELLDPYIPIEVDLDASLLDFIGKILDNIVASGKHADYLASIELMYGISIDDLVQKPVDDVVAMFADGLVDNKILALIEFYRGLEIKVWQTKTSSSISR